LIGWSVGNRADDRPGRTANRRALADIIASDGGSARSGSRADACATTGSHRASPGCKTGLQNALDRNIYVIP
jgi:hypothetical protein